MRTPNKPTDVFKFIKMGNKDECWPFTGKVNNKGRPYFAVAGTKHLVYRLVYELVKGDNALEGKIARHTCDNEICCNPNHIVPGDHQQNMDDMKERERHGLPHHTIRAIRKLATDGRTHAEIADLYGIGRSTVTEIVNRTHYGHVKDEE
jgi:hypothetical protein